MITVSFAPAALTVGRGIDREEKARISRAAAASTVQPVQVDMESLLSAVQRHGAVFYPGHVKDPAAGVATENFKASNLILLGFDNDKDGNVMTWDDVFRHSFAVENAAFVFESPNTTAENNRFRIGFVLPETIDDYRVYEELAQCIGDHFPQQFDIITRPTWGFRGCVVKVIAGNGSCQKLRREVFHALVCNAYMQRTSESRQSNRQGDRLTLVQVQELLSYIPTQLHYTEWQSIVFGVSSELEEDEALTAIEYWSPGRDKHYQELIRRDKRRGKTGTTIATVVKWAKDYGWPGWKKKTTTNA